MRPFTFLPRCWENERWRTSSHVRQCLFEIVDSSRTIQEICVSSKIPRWNSPSPSITRRKPLPPMNRLLKTIWNERVSWRNTMKWAKKIFKLDNRNYSKDRWNLVNPLRCSLALFTLSRSDQSVGLEWLRTLHEVGWNGIFADEMGLGTARLVEGSTTFLSLFG